MNKLYIVKEYQFKSFSIRFAYYLLVVFGIVLFISSLFFNAYCTNQSCVNSVLVLLFGWLNFLGAGISWIVNPLIFCSWVLLFKKSRYAFIVSFFAALFSSSFLLFNSVLADEAGNYAEIIGIKTGYWLWLSSCILTFISSVLFLYGTEIKEIDNRGL